MAHAELKHSLNLFVPRDEMINLAVPIFFLLLFAVTQALGMRALTYHSIHILFINFFLFNTLHVAPTFFMVFYLPEFHAWYRDQSTAEKIWHLTRLVLAVTLIALLFSNLYTDFRDPISAFAWEFFVALMPGFHNLRQIQGLSSAYNQILKPDDTLHVSRWQRGVRREKALFAVFIASLLITGHVFFIRYEGHRSGNLWFPSVMMVLVVGILLNSCTMFTGVALRRKLVYQLRLLLFPFTFTFRIPIWGVTGVHGLEYWFVWRKMSANSKFRPALSAKLVFALLLCLVTVCGIVGYKVWPFDDLSVASRPGAERWFAALSAMSTSLVYIHYYLDRQIFAMKDPLVRKNIAPLLIRPVAVVAEAETVAPRPTVPAPRLVLPSEIAVN